MERAKQMGDMLIKFTNNEQFESTPPGVTVRYENNANGFVVRGLPNGGGGGSPNIEIQPVVSARVISGQYAREIPFIGNFYSQDVAAAAGVIYDSNGSVISVAPNIPQGDASFVAPQHGDLFLWVIINHGMYTYLRLEYFVELFEERGITFWIESPPIGFADLSVSRNWIINGVDSGMNAEPKSADSDWVSVKKLNLDLVNTVGAGYDSHILDDFDIRINRSLKRVELSGLIRNFRLNYPWPGTDLPGTTKVLNFDALGLDLVFVPTAFKVYTVWGNDWLGSLVMYDVRMNSDGLAVVAQSEVMFGNLVTFGTIELPYTSIRDF